MSTGLRLCHILGSGCASLNRYRTFSLSMQNDIGSEILRAIGITYPLFISFVRNRESLPEGIET